MEVLMARWSEFEVQAPEIAEAGRALFYGSGPGLAFLATVRRDGGPRLHPICVNIVAGGLYTLIMHSPKRQDLLRDGRFALHSFPSQLVDDEFYLTGRAVPQTDPELASAVATAQEQAGGTTAGDEMLFELLIERVLYVRYAPRDGSGSVPPGHLRWADPALHVGERTA
jgi:hypothetical protein